MLISAVGGNRTLLRRLLEGGRSPSLDVAHTAATTLPPSRHRPQNGALLDELPLATLLAPLLETNLQTEPCDKLHPEDASPSGAASRPLHGRTGSLCAGWPREKASTFALIGRLGTGERDQPPQACYTWRNTGKTTLGTCGFARGLGGRLKKG